MCSLSPKKEKLEKRGEKGESYKNVGTKILMTYVLE
jgi:hypothetical protein